MPDQLVEELAEVLEDLNMVYMEAGDEGDGIHLACDFCRDQGRSRIVKQLGWTLTFQHAIEQRDAHLREHPILAQDNDA